MPLQSCIAKQAFKATRHLAINLISPSLTSRLVSTSDALFSLRPYQDACIDSCLQTLQSGTTRIGVSLPTGSGKTTVFLSLLARIPPRSRQGSRALVIVNSIQLARQTAKQSSILFPDYHVEIEQGSAHKASGAADITIATYQTLLQPERLKKFSPQNFKAIVIDEAHHAAAPSYRQILSHFHPGVGYPGNNPVSTPLVQTTPVALIGFSATFSRHDGLALGDVFEQIVYHRPLSEMIKERWLSDLKFTSVQADLNLSAVSVSKMSGDFNATSLSKVMNTAGMNELVVKTWLDRLAIRRSTLIFCANLAHVRDLTNTFREAGLDARYIHSQTSHTERDRILSDFTDGIFPILVNCALLTEGADIPAIDSVILARPTKSSNFFAQMIGRGLRLSSNTGKVDCHIVDFVDCFGRLQGVVTIPTLFGLPPSIIQNATCTDFNSLREILTDPKRFGNITDDQSMSSEEIPKTVTYIDYADPFAIIDDASGAPHIAQLSPLAWVGCGQDVYVLECLKSGFLRVEPMHDINSKFFEASFTPTKSVPNDVLRFERKQRVLIAESIGAAIRGCDTYVKQQVLPGNAFFQLLRSAGWRKSPASQSQLDFLRKRRRNVTIPTVKKSGVATFDDTKVTKGQAANMITRLKHGAQKRFARSFGRLGQRKPAGIHVSRFTIG